MVLGHPCFASRALHLPSSQALRPLHHVSNSFCLFAMIHPNESGLTAVLDIKTLSLVGGALALFYFLVTTIVQWYRLSHIPGPWLASLTYWWIYPAVKGKDFHRTVLELQGNYGKVVRISPTGVMLADPETFWRINCKTLPLLRFELRNMPMKTAIGPCRSVAHILDMRSLTALQKVKADADIDACTAARSSYPRDDWYDAMSFNPYGRSVCMIFELFSSRHLPSAP